MPRSACLALAGILLCACAPARGPDGRVIDDEARMCSAGSETGSLPHCSVVLWRPRDAAADPHWWRAELRALTPSSVMYECARCLDCDRDPTACAHPVYAAVVLEEHAPTLLSSGWHVGTFRPGITCASHRDAIACPGP